MPSAALNRWTTVRAATLDELEQAHRAVGGLGPGRRYATLQINHAYTVLLSSQCQGFCRDLHTECASAVALHLPIAMRGILQNNLLVKRELDRGNARYETILQDFGRFDFHVWNALYALDRRNQQRQRLLEEMNQWRNAIAHQNFDRVGGVQMIQLQQVRRWRGAFNQLAVSLDTVMRQQLINLTGVAPF